VTSLVIPSIQRTTVAEYEAVEDWIAMPEAEKQEILGRQKQ
jgi:hypothetical protein